VVEPRRRCPVLDAEDAEAGEEELNDDPESEQGEEVPVDGCHY